MSDRKTRNVGGEREREEGVFLLVEIATRSSTDRPSGGAISEEKQMPSPSVGPSVPSSARPSPSLPQLAQLDPEQTDGQTDELRYDNRFVGADSGGDRVPG